MVGVGYNEVAGIWTGGDWGGSGGRSSCQESGDSAEDTATEKAYSGGRSFFHDFLAFILTTWAGTLLRRIDLDGLDILVVRRLCRCGGDQSGSCSRTDMTGGADVDSQVDRSMPRAHLSACGH